MAAGSTPPPLAQEAGPGRAPTSARRAIVLLALAVVAYTLAAWSTAPGFYDGFAPTAPYNWLSPPAQFQAGNQSPSSGHMVIKVSNGATPEIGVATDDGQAQLVLPAAAFQVSATTAQVTVDIRPAAQFPAPTAFQTTTNVYLISASAPLAKPAQVQLRYSHQVAPPTNIYSVPAGATTWARLPLQPTSAQYFVSVSTPTFGYFVAGIATATAGAGAQGQGSASSEGTPVLALLIGAAVVLGLLLALPTLILKLRRRPSRKPRKRPARVSVPPSGQAEAPNKGGSRRRRRLKH
ncbi:MAG: hypothetical protein M3072_08970 [Candidatus Dormibacteraeota bacterium]|nr:hypothetical protein [Candidatus Dormibacteraeota bacterium]